MLTRNSQVAPQQEYYADSLLTAPTGSDTVFHNLAMGFATPVMAMNMLNADMAKKPEGQAMLSTFNSIRLENETPGLSTGQWLAGEGSSMLGFGLNPATWGLGELGGLAARGISTGAARVAPDAATVFMRQPIKELVKEPIGRYIPAMVGREGAEKPLSLGLLSDETLKNFGIFAGAGVPQGIVDNYKADTNHIEWGGVAREAGEMGAFGMAIGAIPFAWGVLRGKVNRGLGKEPTAEVGTSQLDEALAKGHITEAEHKWYSDYIEHQAQPENLELKASLEQQGSHIINENGHTANVVSNEALFEIMTPDDVSNLHGVIADQLASGIVDEEQRMALSNFIVHNRLDFIRQKPEWLDGARGYVDHVNQKLEMKTQKLLEHDEILDKHLLKGMKENMLFSQKELFKNMKEASFEASHVEHLPVTIPENIIKHLKKLESIPELKRKNKIYFKKFKKTGEDRFVEKMKRNDEKITEIKESLPKLLSPKEELQAIRDELMGKGLKPGFEHSNAYHRLLDLSNVWHNARTLLDRVHLEHEYNKQQAFRDLAHQILRIADSDMPRISKPDNVIDYMRRRIEGNLNKLEPLSEVNRVVSEHEAIPTDADTILSDQAQQFDKSAAESMKKEYTQAADRFTEFKSTEGIFKNLISCVMGGLGG